MKKNRGFTLIETLVVIGIFLVLAGISSMSLGNLYPQANLSVSTNVLMSDIKTQQLKSMTGYSFSSTQIESHGVYFEPTQYTLFTGSSFSPADTRNIVISPGVNISLSTVNITGNTLIFSAGSGEVAGYVVGGVVTVTETNTSQQKSLEINPMGSISL